MLYRNFYSWMKAMFSLITIFTIQIHDEKLNLNFYWVAIVYCYGFEKWLITKLSCLISMPTKKATVSFWTPFLDKKHYFDLSILSNSNWYAIQTRTVKESIIMSTRIVCVFLFMLHVYFEWGMLLNWSFLFSFHFFLRNLLLVVYCFYVWNIAM